MLEHIHTLPQAVLLSQDSEGWESVQAGLEYIKKIR